jgi:hypothetical protein
MAANIQTYRVCLSSKRGKVPKGRDGLYRAYYNIQSSSPEKAIECAKRHCIVLQGNITGDAWLFTSNDLAYSWQIQDALNGRR